MSTSQQPATFADLKLVGRTCLVNGCDRTDVVGRGLCRKHDLYEKRHGYPEIAPDKNEPLPLSERDAAWLAAVIDCEGWIGTCGTRGKYHNRIGVGNTNPRLIERLVAMTGCGSVRYVSKPKSPNAKPQWHWNVHRRDDIRAILLAILPHLILKDAQARLVLALPPKHTKDNAQRVATHLALRALNKKGVA